MDNIFMNSKNSKTSDPHRLLLLNLSDKIDFKRSVKMLLYQILAFTMHNKIWKSHTKVTNLKYQLHYFAITSSKFELPDVSYPVSDFKIILNIS